MAEWCGIKQKKHNIAKGPAHDTPFQALPLPGLVWFTKEEIRCVHQDILPVFSVSSTHFLLPVPYIYFIFILRVYNRPLMNTSEN